ncbi:hypothetical protein AV274_0685 [Blastocystis sp. ATCC 50177/Nand II]|uniref:Asteroid domain-containing protein n=1 Tax=Blastocystis sp. subtype 1 (strain ATCC 50177 / NandII) TaxID=478820 RepID=A0A196SMQ5_BLAHN|nr:hypothetical protein AV274_0685 [Blastocystis sp. ATCC 50177/Nand II]
MGNKELLSILKNNPKAKCKANTSISLISRYAVKNAIKDCYRNVQFFSGGLDCDRDIAKYAKKQNCYVMTSDCDFFVFDVPGVIHLRWMLSDIDIFIGSHSIDVYPHDRMMERLNLNYNSIRYLAFLYGNDFVDSVGINVDAIVHICQGVGDSYEAVVKDATQRFPGLDVEKSMRKVWKKYDLDSYPEFPRSWDEVEDEEEDDCNEYNEHYYDDDYDDYEEDEEDEEDEDGDGENEDNEDENIEEQAEESVDQLLPEFVNSFTVLNSSTSLNYIFSPIITLPVPYKKDDVYMHQVQYLKILIFDFLGRGQKDPNPHVILPCDTKSAIETNYNKFLKKHSFIVKKRILYCKKVRDLPAMDRLALLKEKMHPVFDNLALSPSLLDEHQSNTLFSTALIQVVQFLRPEEDIMVVEALNAMLDGRDVDVEIPYEEAFLAFDALQCALDAITVLFEILLLPIPMDVIKRIDLAKLLK